MAQSLKESTYSKEDIYNFLTAKGYGFAASVWLNEKSKEGRIGETEAQKWFVGYFPIGTASQMWREMQTVCVGFMEVVNS